MAAPSIRLYVQDTLSHDRSLACSQAQSNYLLNVMRLGNGDHVLVFDGISGEWLARILMSGRNACELHVLEQTRKQTSGPDLYYLFAPLKRARLDYMVQKATEMGVAKMQPVITHRTEAKRVKLERMEANAIEAAEQCGILWIPKILQPLTLEKLLERWDPERRVIYCDEAAAAAWPLDVLRGLQSGPLAVLVGPEGGFDEAEREKLSRTPFVTPISLGPRVMRADTAAIAALALVNSVLGDWR